MTSRQACMLAFLWLVGLLTGCSSAPQPRPAPASLPTPTSLSAPATPASVKPPLAAGHAPAAPAAPDVWQRLRNDFALPDCIPPALQRARREARYPQVLAGQLQQAAAVIDYVQRQVQARGIAGEFALLPWVESHFHEVPPRRGRAAGMWQIMPITAQAHGMLVTPGYDARLDKTVATGIALDMLAGYHRQWADWRLADMAYNAGAGRIRRIVHDHGLPPQLPVLPDLPLRDSTLNHLVKLLAIACIVRDPSRFDVQLPLLPDADRLRTFKLPVPADLRQVARLSGLPWKTVHALNAGYRGPITPMRSPRTLLLPAHALPALERAIAAGKLTDQSRLALEHGGNGPLGPPIRHTVRAGDSLWRIAHRYGLTVSQLRRWNHLSPHAVLHPGQRLWLAAPD